MLNESEKKIFIESVINTYNNFGKEQQNWIKASFFINAVGGCSLLYYYPNELEPKQLKGSDGWSIDFENSSKITELLSRERNNDQTTRWNKGQITIYPDGRFESEFSWDQEAYLTDIEGGVWSAIYYLSTFFEDVINQEVTTYENWQQADIEIAIKDGKPAVKGSVNTHEKEIAFTKELPENIIEGFLRMHQDTTQGELQSRFPLWNTLCLHLVNRQYFEVKEQTKFVWK